MGWMQNHVKSQGVQILIIALFVAIAGEFKITPFSGEIFRIGLGSSTFLLLLLLIRQLPYIKTGIAVGVTVLLFRTLLDIASTDHLMLLDSLRKHFSAMLYYIVFAIGMRLIQERLHELHPLILGACTAVIDFMSNEMELIARSTLYHLPFVQPSQWLLISVTAVVRCYFTIGLYSSIMVSQMRIVHAEQQKRMEQMLTINSGLYGEVFYLKKSMDAIEKITVKSYDLYCRLNESPASKDYSKSILEITQQIHEIKKDSQRILAGLIKLTDKETASELALSEIVQFVLKSNQEYSSMLRKEIRMEHELRTNYPTSHYIPLLTVLNNLVSNAVEAIEVKGTIRIQVYALLQDTVFIVSDTGSGISEPDKEVVFEPGFTTKFNQEGIAATGIGLSHVRDIVKSFGGSIELKPYKHTDETTFVVSFPTKALYKE
ncbi:ATP-binding protein [Paenibacillus thalictri]|uniref:histidine kinase n=1 Tax=Paenibacillus thalictri TaxID=2527873 RepID=A0A4Q9DS93_9BACL|nr:ATP-binding protein [Paenibacillus thalictri]TBL78634.1 GHKL domain-containing protein [Paenibacillus thalictri]